MTTIKAIPTQYAGYTFRSRLEARAAVLFDKLGLIWEYEPEGFDLPVNGWYLPDFLIKKNKYIEEDLWIECKGTAPTLIEDNKLTELSHITGLKGAFFVGTQHLRYVYNCLTPTGHYFEEEFSYICRLDKLINDSMDLIKFPLPYYFSSYRELWEQTRDEFCDSKLNGSSFNSHITQYLCYGTELRILTKEEEESIYVIGGEEYVKFVKSWITLQHLRDSAAYTGKDVLGGRFHIEYPSNPENEDKHRYKINLFKNAISAALSNNFE